MQHYINETTLQVSGFDPKDGSIPCDIPKTNEDWDIETHSWVLNTDKVAESARVEAKRIRDEALQANTYTLTVDTVGYVYQVRPQDLPILEKAIERNVDRKWMMANNKSRFTTVAELSEIALAGTNQGEAIWDEFIDTVDAL
jgi:hypothetical protein